MNCKDISELFAAYLDNEVTPEEREQIEAHLPTCPHCQEELEAIAATQGQLRQALKAAAGQAAPSPQAWVGIKQRLGVEERPRVTILGLAKSKLEGGKDIVMKGLVLRQPVWKTAMISVLAVALIAGLSLGILLHDGQSAEAQAEGIAEKDPQVQLALGGEVKAVKVLRLGDDEGIVLCEGELGQFVTAEVDLKAEKVIEVVPMPEFTKATEEEAVNIAKADPRVQELLDRGANIGNVTLMYSFELRVDPETGEREESSGALARVEIKLGDKIWFADVDLDEEKVVSLIEMTLVPMESSFAELTEAQKAQAIEIATSDPRVQELLNSGATIFKVMPVPSRVETYHSVDGEVFALIPDGKCVGVALRYEGDPQDEDRSWLVEVSLAEGRVLNIVEDHNEIHNKPKSEKVKPLPDFESRIDEQGSLDDA